MKQYFLIYLLTVITLLASCTNPFTTRADQVEKPDIGDIEYADYNTPENIITNFILAIEKRDLPGYMNCFSADAARFKFDYEPHFYDAFQAREWTLNDEEDFFSQLKVNTVSLGFSFAAGSAPAHRTRKSWNKRSESTNCRTIRSNPPGAGSCAEAEIRRSWSRVGPRAWS